MQEKQGKTDIHLTGLVTYVNPTGVWSIMVCPDLVIWTVIFPAAEGSLSLVTPALTENVCWLLPILSVTWAAAVVKATAHR